MSTPTIRTQWHIAANGDVGQSWWTDEEPDKVTHGRYATTRPVQMSELLELERNATHIIATGDRRSGAAMVVIGVGIIGALGGWLVLPALGVGSTASTVVFVVSAVLAVLAVVEVFRVPGRTHRRLVAAHEAAGLDQASHTVLKQDVAAALIEDPGTENGPRPASGPPR